MKILKCVIVLLAFIGLTLVGCSDQSQSPVAPTDQSISGQVSLDKITIREFTGTSFPIEVTNAGITKYPDGKMIIRGMLNKILFNASFTDGGTDLLSGAGDLELNGNVDPIAGTTDWWGKLTLTPSASEAQGGQYKLTWHGRGTLSASGWTIPLKEVGHGEGGALTGIQCFFEHIVTAPPDLSSWTGAANGYIKLH
jgi:hypothetical protein